jgi:hypothetical protein
MVHSTTVRAVLLGASASMLLAAAAGSGQNVATPLWFGC